MQQKLSPQDSAYAAKLGIAEADVIATGEASEQAFAACMTAIQAATNHLPPRLRLAAMCTTMERIGDRAAFVEALVKLGM